MMFDKISMVDTHGDTMTLEYLIDMFNEFFPEHTSVYGRGVEMDDEVGIAKFDVPYHNPIHILDGFACSDHDDFQWGKLTGSVVADAIINHPDVTEPIIELMYKNYPALVMKSDNVPHSFKMEKVDNWEYDALWHCDRDFIDLLMIDIHSNADFLLYMLMRNPLVTCEELAYMRSLCSYNFSYNMAFIHHVPWHVHGRECNCVARTEVMNTVESDSYLKSNVCERLTENY